MNENNLKSPIPKTLWIAYQVLATLLALSTTWLFIKNIPLFYHARWDDRFNYYLGPMFCQFFFILACLSVLLQRRWSYHLVFVTGTWFAFHEGYHLMQLFEDLIRGMFPVDQVETWRLVLGFLLSILEIVLITTLITLSHKIKNTFSDHKSTIFRPAFTIVLLKNDLILKISIALMGIALLHGWLSHKQAVFFFEQSDFIGVPVSVLLMVPAVIILLLYHYLQTKAPHAVASLGISGILCFLFTPVAISWSNYLIWIPPIILGILALRTRQGTLLLRITALALPVFLSLYANDFHPPFYL